MTEEPDPLNTEEEEPDVFGLSFLDLISGAFGAAFFLFLIFTTFPMETGSTRSSGDSYLEIWLTWPDTKFSYEPLVQYDPGNGTPVLIYRLSSGLFRDDEGQPGKIEWAGRGKKFWGDVYGSGFSDSRAPALRQMGAPGDVNFGLWLHFTDPCPGTYSFRVNRNAVFGRATTDWSEANSASRWDFRVVFHDSSGRSKTFQSNPDTQPLADREEIAPLVRLASGPAEQYEYVIDTDSDDKDLEHCQ